MCVTHMDQIMWGLVWTCISDDFDASLPEEWKDLRGRKLLLWDGNHRVKAWISHMHESMFSFLHIFFFLFKKPI